MSCDESPPPSRSRSVSSERRASVGASFGTPESCRKVPNNVGLPTLLALEETAVSTLAGQGSLLLPTGGLQHSTTATLAQRQYAGSSSHSVNTADVPPHLRPEERPICRHNLVAPFGDDTCGDPVALEAPRPPMTPSERQAAADRAAMSTVFDAAAGR